MDVAVFVGFAASGPLHTPVVVEDVAQFLDVFGDAVPVAWDERRGEYEYSHLAPSVRAFFRNGGRRCWIIRVAGNAAGCNYYPVPGLARVESRPGEPALISPAYVQARSEGSWSDSLKVSATLTSRALRVAGISLSLAGPEVDLELASSVEVVAGDLLRLTFRTPHQSYVLLLPIKSVKRLETDTPPLQHGERGGPNVPVRSSWGARPMLRVVGASAIWLRSSPESSMPAGLTGTARVPVSGTSASPPEQANTVYQEVAATTLATQSGDDPGEIRLRLAMPFDGATMPSFVQITFDDVQRWFVIREARPNFEGSPPSEGMEVVGQELWFSPFAPPDAVLDVAPQGEVLSFELWVRRGNGHPVRLPDLAFAPPHPRYWRNLPTDATLYDPEVEASKGPDSTALWHATASPRFPLAATDEAPGEQSEDTSVLYLPVGMEALPNNFSGPVPTQGAARQKDGLDEFSSALFLDPQLIGSGAETLMSEADYLRYQSPLPRRLKGMHAALAIDEATLLAVPDAAHRHWSRSGPASSPPQAEPVSPPERPQWWHFLDCDPPQRIPRVSQPERGNFLDRDLVVLDAPLLEVAEGPDPAGSFTLTWNEVAGEDVRYVLEESTDPAFKDAVTVYAGPDTRMLAYGRGAGTYYYHVRAEVGEEVSDWSVGLVLVVGGGDRVLLEDLRDYDSRDLLDIHRSLLRMCAARGDLLAVLALPQHFREDDAIGYANSLKAPYIAEPGNGVVQTGQERPAPLGGQEARAFSYGAVYHPWLAGSIESSPGLFVRTPPDGAACGVMSLRALSRGAWIAPANVPLRGVVALEPHITPDRWLDLQQAQINVVRQEARGFLAMSAYTLSTDPDLELINVRRLLILLRRLALKLGATYVFEPNSPAFRRIVQRGFESVLEYMFERGAFAGATRENAFRVVASSTPQEMDLGRFIVELKVAPSLPMTFLTVRLVQAGDRAIVTEEL